MAKKEVTYKELTDKERQFLKLLSYENTVSTSSLRDINIIVKSGNEFFTAHNGVISGYIIKRHDGGKRDKLEITEDPESKVRVPFETFYSGVIAAEPFEKLPKACSRLEYESWSKSSWDVDKFLEKYPNSPELREHYIKIGDEFFDLKNVWHTMKALSIMGVHTIDIHRLGIRAVWTAEEADLKFGGAFMGMVKLNMYLQRTVDAILDSAETETFLKNEPIEA